MQVLWSEAIKVKKPPSGNAPDGSSVEVAIVAGLGATEIARTVAIGALVAKTVNGTGSKTATSHDIQEEQKLNGHLGILSCANRFPPRNDMHSVQLCVERSIYDRFVSRHCVAHVSLRVLSHEGK